MDSGTYGVTNLQSQEHTESGTYRVRNLQSQELTESGTYGVRNLRSQELTVWSISEKKGRFMASLTYI
jgi:hypothetical protein